MNMDFEVDSKTVIDNIYGKQLGVSDFNSIIQECPHTLLCTDLANSNVNFIKRQVNEAAHSLTKEAPISLASFHIFYKIFTCIETIFFFFWYKY